MPDARDIRFHHVGVAVRDIGAAAEQFARVFGAAPASEVFHDPAQSVYIQFLTLGGLRIELLAPAGENSPAAAMLDRGISIYHVCFEADDFDARLAEWTAHGAVLVSPPKPAVAFGNRRVAFVMHLRFMVELVESPDDSRSRMTG